MLTPLNHEEIELVRASTGNLVPAVKAYRERAGVDLGAAVSACRAVRDALDAGEPVEPGAPPGLTVPHVHLNGTSRDALARGYRTAAAAVRVALASLGETAPHGRDYYCHPAVAVLGEGGPLKKAQDEHAARLRALTEVERELTELARAVYAQGK